MYRKAFERPRSTERDLRFRIPRDDGTAVLLEAMILLFMVAVLAITLGLVVGVPLALLLNDICASLKC